jgi:hypothetical protein
MDNPIVKILRLLVFFPICFLIMALLNWGLVYVFIWFLGLSPFWLFVAIFFLGSSIWTVFTMFAVTLSLLATMISPIDWLGRWTISILAILNGIYLGYKIWTLELDYNGWEIFSAILATLLILELTFALIFGSFEAD